MDSAHPSGGSGAPVPTTAPSLPGGAERCRLDHGQLAWELCTHMRRHPMDHTSPEQAGFTNEPRCSVAF